MLELFMVVIMPGVVLAATQLTKQIKPIPELGGHRILIVRAIMALYALGGALLTIWVGDVPGGDIDPGLIETAILSVVNAGVATWMYLGTKK